MITSREKKQKEKISLLLFIVSEGKSSKCSKKMTNVKEGKGKRFLSFSKQTKQNMRGFWLGYCIITVFTKTFNLSANDRSTHCKHSYYFVGFVTNGRRRLERMNLGWASGSERLLCPLESYIGYKNRFLFIFFQEMHLTRPFTEMRQPGAPIGQRLTKKLL